MPVLATVSAEDEASATPGVSMPAVISGVLTINDHGCFEIDGHIMVAPHGSHATEDPVGIHVPGAGDFPLGSHLQSWGAYVDELVTGSDDEVGTDWNHYLTSTSRGFAVIHGAVTRLA